MREQNNSQNQLYGLHPIMEALLSGQPMDKIFLQQDLKGDQINELKELAANLNVSVIKAPKEKLNKICRFKHQGVVAFSSPVEFGNVEEVIQSVYEQSQTPLLLMLDKVSDVRNFGSIIRSALSAGCHAIVIPFKGAAAINEETVKTSAGAVFHIPICKVQSLGDTIKYLHSCGITTIACTEKADQLIYDHDLSGPVNILMGNEGAGIDPHLIRMARNSAKIPMLGEVGSLNVAVASAVTLYEVVRQRTIKP